MAAFLSESWFEDLRRMPTPLPERRGADARLEVVVGGAPGGDVRCAWVVEAGIVRDAALGAADAADATLTTTWADAVQMQMMNTSDGRMSCTASSRAASDSSRSRAGSSSSAGETSP